MTYESRHSNAVYALNAYLWKLLESNLGWKKSDYGNDIPIIPTQQQPEMMQSGKPFIVYGSAMRQSGHLYEIHNESVSYIIYSTSATEANNVVSLLSEVFKRADDAAADINWFIDTENRTPKRKVGFLSVKAPYTQKAEPADEEGGFIYSHILVDTSYVNLVKQQVVTRDFA